jgi:predicted transcriptional regulator of viral defense system
VNREFSCYDYTIMDSHKLLPGKARLAAVIKTAGAVVLIDDAVKALQISRSEAAKILSRWAGQGWLRRVGAGAYVPVQLEFLDAAQVVDDPWILVPTLFDPAYIGGRTAAEHWDLTEQIFRDIVVYTARRVTHPTVERQGAVFSLRHTDKDRMFGTQAVWRGQTKIAVSDIHRTIIDMLSDPPNGGGIQHVADCFGQYLSRPDRDSAKLIKYAEQLGNGAVFKRLGFLAERLQNGEDIVEASKTRLTKGHALLDPALDCARLVTRWRLRVPDSWIEKP